MGRRIAATLIGAVLVLLITAALVGIIFLFFAGVTWVINTGFPLVEVGFGIAMFALFSPLFYDIGDEVLHEWRKDNKGAETREG